MNYGFVKVAAAVPKVTVADCRRNTEQIETLLLQANNEGAEIVCFPELSITAYSCGDLFGQQLLLDEAEMQLINLLNFSRSMDIIAIVGMPVSYGGALLNAAVVLQKGRLLGIVPKTYLPNYKEFYEQRWFTSALDVPEGHVMICGQQVPVSPRMLFHTPSCVFGIEICEDLWAPLPPSCHLAMRGADIIFNPTADNDLVGKLSYLHSLVSQQSARCIAGYVLSGCGFGESTQDVVYRGKTLIYENGIRLSPPGYPTLSDSIAPMGDGITPASDSVPPTGTDTDPALEGMLTLSEIDVERLRTERRANSTFTSCARQLRDEPFHLVETAKVTPPTIRLTRPISPHPFVPEGDDLNRRCREILDIQTEGLMKRITHTNCETLVIGISGGLDSTLALLVSARAFDRLSKSRRGIVGITMPGFGTSDRTYTNAICLMQQLGVTIREINIRKAVMQHFADLGHDPAIHDVVYENSQARERTQILMDAANQMKGLVVGTGDLSELALGWATYNGDHMSMYSVNASVPKTLVRHLVSWQAARIPDENTRHILADILATPISPELLPPEDEEGKEGMAATIAQQTEDLVGPYELHDFYLYYLLRWGYRPAKLLWLAKQAFAQSHLHDGATPYDEATLKHWLTVFVRRFFAQQYKRSCQPDGPKVGTCSLSPRGDWRMPSDASPSTWLSECEAL